MLSQFMTKAEGTIICSKGEPGVYWDTLGLQGQKHLKFDSWVNSVTHIQTLVIWL